jgi:hypothetical protein
MCETICLRPSAWPSVFHPKRSAENSTPVERPGQFSTAGLRA